jgi:hypothetical protein
MPNKTCASVGSTSNLGRTRAPAGGAATNDAAIGRRNAALMRPSAHWLRSGRGFALTD